MKLLTDAIKNTTTYKVGNIEFRVEKDRVYVWSPDTYNGTFHATEIGTMAEAMGFNAYVRYNEERLRCEMSIF